MKCLAFLIVAMVWCGCASQPAPAPLSENVAQKRAEPVSHSDSIWKNCSGIREKDNTDRITCRDLTIFAFRSARSDVEAMMTDYLKHNDYDFDDGNDVRVERWKIGAAIGYRYELAPKLVRDEERKVSVVAILGVEGGSRMVTCTSRRADLLATRCRPFVIEALAGDPKLAWSGGKAPLNWMEGTFVGRALQEEEGCRRRRPDDQNINCGDSGQLSWRHEEQVDGPLTDVVRRQMLAVEELAKASGARIEVAHYPCAVEGIEVTCTESSMYLPKGEPEVVFVQAIALVRKQKVYVLCSWQGSDIKQAPRPCAQVLNLKLRKQAALVP